MSEAVVPLVQGALLPSWLARARIAHKGRIAPVGLGTRMRAPILHHPACCRGRSRALTCPSNITLVVSGQTVRPSAGTHAACARWSHLHWAPAPLSTHAADCHGWFRTLASASSALFANAKSAQPRRRAPRLSPLDATDTSHVEPAAWRMHRLPVSTRSSSRPGTEPNATPLSPRHFHRRALPSPTDRLGPLRCFSHALCSSVARGGQPPRPSGALRPYRVRLVCT